MFSQTYVELHLFCDFAKTGHLVGPGGQDESGQSSQVSGSTQVSRQQRVTHDDVATQD